ncbi:MAG: adenylate/guanylate cyclase domain-containing protein [Pseudomonadota bacterium]
MKRRDRWKWRFPALLAFAFILPFLSTHLWFIASLERTIHDAYRFIIAERVGYDPDIALVVYDDEVARNAQRTSPVDRVLLAKAVSAIASARPRAIGLDMAFVQETDETAQLVAALRRVNVPLFAIYADPEGDRAVYWSPVVDASARADQTKFWDALQGSKVQPASPAIGVGPARVARNWPETVETSAPLMAHALADTPEALRGYTGGIRYRVLAGDTLASAGTDIDAATGMFPTYPIDLVSDELFAGDILPKLENRIVLIGSDTFNADQLATPISRVGVAPRSPGVAVHAHMTRQAMDRDFPPAIGLAGTALLAVLVIVFAASSAVIERRLFLLLSVLGSQVVALAILPIVLDAMGYDILGVPLFGLIAASVTAYFACASTLRDRRSEERAFARGALGRYVPESVAQQILADPDRLQLRGEERELVMMFTDLEGYTAFCHGREPRETAAILNTYLDAMTEVVLAHGGTLDKYVGDAIVAFWGSPIAYEDDAARAVACALAMQAEAERVADRTREKYGEAFGRTRIGLHKGPAIVGNFGGTSRMQYTAMGDAMNIAARLESANKQIGSNILISSALAQAAPGFHYRKLGRIAMAGVSTGVELLEPLPAAQQAYAERWNAAIQAFESGADNAESLWAQCVADAEGDAAIAGIEARLTSIQKGEVHVLQSK